MEAQPPAISLEAPGEFREVVKAAETTYGIKITFLAKLRGGKSGAILYLAELRHKESARVEHFVLKLDEIDKEGRFPEAELHELARREAASFAKHIPEVPFKPIEIDGRILMFYGIAGLSLENFRPLSAYVESSQGQLEHLYGEVFQRLLSEWNLKPVIETTHPQTILEAWLGDCISEEGSAEAFAENTYKIGRDTEAIVIESQVIPNPLVYARRPQKWGETRKLSVLSGLVHGDLNTGNVLVNLTHDGILKDYFVIDFSHYSSRSFLLFDQAYLEFSYLIEHASALSEQKWLALINALSHDNIPDPKEVPSEAAGLVSVVAQARIAFEKWVIETNPSLQDDLWGQYRLAAVAVGLNFCSKSRVSTEVKSAAFVYAAKFLDAYISRFHVPGPDSDKIATLDVVAIAPDKSVEWDKFFESCNFFNSRGLYILVAGPQAHSPGPELAPIGYAPWNLIIDFDPETEKNLKAVAGPEIESRRSLHLLTPSDKYELSPYGATYWFAARGLSAIPSTRPAGDTWRDWNRKSSRQLGELLGEFAKKSEERQVTAIICWDNFEYIRKTCELIDENVESGTRYIFICNKAEGLAELVRTYNALTFGISLDDVAIGLRNSFATIGKRTDEVLLPTKSQSSVVIEERLVNWLNEDATLLHLNAGLLEDKGRNTARDFYIGNRISWFELGLHVDIERNRTLAIKRKVEDDLRRRETTRINLYHTPGAGGTTIALRVSWELHSQYPVVILRKITDGTFDRLRAVFDRTDNSILAVVEAAEVSATSLDVLYDRLRKDHLPVVFLIISRRFEKPAVFTDRLFYLQEILEINEANRFAAAYSQQVPSKKEQLQALATSNADLHKFRVPFYFGLTAFERDFQGIQRYVQSRLADLNATEEKIAKDLAIIYRYAHKSVKEELIARLCGYTETNSYRLEVHVGGSLLQLLIHEGLEDGTEGWRPSHSIIADEIAEQLLSKGSPDIRVWRGGLSEWARTFIQDCTAIHEEGGVASDLVLDILTRLFILRETQDPTGTSYAGEHQVFAQFLDDIPSKEGQLGVLKALVESFPEQPHFWAHYGRFLSYVLHEHPSAREAVQKALAIDPNDAKIYHMQGMISRSAVYDLMDAQEREFRASNKIDQVAMDNIRRVVKEAEASFAKSRELDPGGEYSYVSDIQLLIRTVEFGKKVSGNISFVDFLASQDGNDYREMVQKAEELINQLKIRRSGETPSRYEDELGTRIIALYEDFATIIRLWTGLLGRPGIYSPSIRRNIVFAYLARVKRSWDRLRPQDAELIKRYMELNLTQEPGNETNLWLWFEAAKTLPETNIDTAIERLHSWSSISDSLQARYYLYVLYSLKAIDGSTQGLIDANRTLEKCRALAFTLQIRNPGTSQFWLGQGSGMTRLIDTNRLGEWNPGVDFFSNANLLAVTEGRIVSIEGPHKGFIELPSGIRAFFVPGRKHGFSRDKDLNAKVAFYLGFSYDGPRAWNVNYADQTARPLANS